MADSQHRFTPDEKAKLRANHIDTMIDEDGNEIAVHEGTQIPPSTVGHILGDHTTDELPPRPIPKVDGADYGPISKAILRHPVSGQFVASRTAAHDAPGAPNIEHVDGQPSVAGATSMQTVTGNLHYTHGDAQPSANVGIADLRSPTGIYGGLGALPGGSIGQQPGANPDSSSVVGSASIAAVVGVVPGWEA